MGHVQQNVGGHCIVSLTPSSSTILPRLTIFLYSFDEYDFLNGIQLILSQASFCLIVPTISYATPFHFTFLLELTTREVLMNSAREIIREVISFLLNVIEIERASGDIFKIDNCIWRRILGS